MAGQIITKFKTFNAIAQFNFRIKVFQYKIFRFEIVLILLGALIVGILGISSFVITQNKQKDNFSSFQNVIAQNLEQQYLLMEMSNNIRDRMLIVHDIDSSNDEFEVDDLTLEYRAIASKFIKTRAALIQFSLSKEQTAELVKLRDLLANGRITLDLVVEDKNENVETNHRKEIKEARLINIVALGQLKEMISTQLVRATHKLYEIKKTNGESNKEIQRLNVASLIISIFTILFIVITLNKRKRELDQVLDVLQETNANLEDTIEFRTSELMLLQKDHARVNAEIDISRELQRLIVPPYLELKAISDLDIATYVEPAEEMGGDYIDVLPFDEGHLICIGDVTDHGLKSGILMVMVQSMIRHQSNAINKSITTALVDINKSIFQNIDRMRTGRHLSLSLIHHKNNKLEITGQHETIIIIRNDGTLEIHSTDDLGFPVGMVDDIGDFVQSVEIYLEKDDLVILHTDGITEAANNEEALFGFDRLCDIAVENYKLEAYDIVQSILKGVNSFVGAKALYDDIALIVFKQQ